MTGAAGVPLSGVGAVSLNVSVVDPVGSGYVTVFPCGEQPTASNLNYVTGQTCGERKAATRAVHAADVRPLRPEGHKISEITEATVGTSIVVHPIATAFDKASS